MFNTQQGVDQWRLTNPFKWNPNKHMPTLLGNVAPLNDNTNTPRGAKRAITLERSFDRFAWMHTRNALEHLDVNSHAIKIDKEKGKTLRKIVRKQKKQQHMMMTHQASTSGINQSFLQNMNASRGLISLSGS